MEATRIRVHCEDTKLIYFHFSAIRIRFAHDEVHLVIVEKGHLTFQNEYLKVLQFNGFYGI